MRVIRCTIPRNCSTKRGLVCVLVVTRAIWCTIIWKSLLKRSFLRALEVTAVSVFHWCTILPICSTKSGVLCVLEVGARYRQSVELIIKRRCCFYDLEVIKQRQAKCRADHKKQCGFNALDVIKYSAVSLTTGLVSSWSPKKQRVLCTWG